MQARHRLLSLVGLGLILASGVYAIGARTQRYSGPVTGTMSAANWSRYDCATPVSVPNARNPLATLSWASGARPVGGAMSRPAYNGEGKNSLNVRTHQGQSASLRNWAVYSAADRLSAVDAQGDSVKWASDLLAALCS
jgi:hypothetical protein